MRRQARDRGAAAVEFALVVPLLIMLVFGIIDFGYLINRVSVVNNAARDAARVASLNGTEAEVSATATQALNGIPGTSVTVTCRKADGSNCGSYDTDADSGGTAVVTITYVHDMITPVAAIFADSINLSRTAEMRIE
ncbi:TadE/TadG family type IV pilus assembly protein [Nocardioides coralli]|uniref:TadE/TadG family type IV pilus assembly protein n=1 Tax=Nocardioides coralli TaxID=2872154 RepID=UPI001CA3A368|nr:TadE/TadG family type IV pilus assembly protein [Nocardioides coralli]QZY28705.1 pilus assembly protein [Nocardioides coralli]